MDQLRPTVMRPFGRFADALRTGVLAMLLLIASAGAGCGSAAAPRLPLASTEESPRALAAELLEAIAGNDRTRLEELAVTEHEFRTVVWPKLPSSRPEVGLPVDYAWSDLHTKSRLDLQNTLAALGGRRLDLVGIEFRGETSDYGTYRVHRKSMLQVRTPSGETMRVGVFGSMIELEGRVKVFSYVVD